MLCARIPADVAIISDVPRKTLDKIIDDPASFLLLQTNFLLTTLNEFGNVYESNNEVNHTAEVERQVWKPARAWDAKAKSGSSCDEIQLKSLQQRRLNPLLYTHARYIPAR